MKKAALAVLAVAALGTTAAAIAWAAAGDSAVIHACVAKGSDLVRIPGAGDGCRSNETGVDWNAQGPAGSQGRRDRRGQPGGSASEPNARVVGFMHVDGGTLGTIDGEATEQGHEKWITVEGYDGDTDAPRLDRDRRRRRSRQGAVQADRDHEADRQVDAEAVPGARHRPAPAGGPDRLRPPGRCGWRRGLLLGEARAGPGHRHPPGRRGEGGRHTLEQVSLDFQSIEITESGGTASGGGPPS